MRAIEVGTPEEIAARAGATMELRDLPSSGLTRPRSRYRVRPEAKGMARKG
jgi:hypothetical protein